MLELFEPGRCTATAANVGGRLVIRSDTVGSSATLQLTDGTGSPLTALSRIIFSRGLSPLTRFAWWQFRQVSVGGTVASKFRPKT